MRRESPTRDVTPKTLALPTPMLGGPRSLESTLAARRSVREYRKLSVTAGELGQLLWAAQGLTSAEGLRTAPSAGALYPLEVCVVAAAVDDVRLGIYRYDPRRHALGLVVSGDHRAALAAAALGQSSVATAAAVVVLAAVPTRTTVKYGTRGLRYVHMEVGHAAQNVCLEAAEGKSVTTDTRPNSWRFEPDTLVLALYVDGRYMYEVDLERCTTSAEAPDWIVQVTKKAWTTDAIVADLVRALDNMLDLQATMCSGQSTKVNVNKAVKGRRVRPVRGGD